MNHKFTFGCILILMSGAAANAQQKERAVVVSGATLTGKVLDLVQRTPLVGAVVTVTVKNAAGGEPRVVISEEDGSYKISGLVSNKQYRVTYSKEEYAPDERLVTVSATQDGTLLKQRADAAYWKMAAEIMTKRIQAGDPSENNDAFVTTWEGLRASTISADGKAIVAKHLQGGLPPKLWNASHTFNAYAAADPDELRTVEKAYALHHTSPDTFTVDPTILRDIKGTSKKMVVAPQ